MRHVKNQFIPHEAAGVIAGRIIVVRIEKVR
ncbi:MAG: hypothetical protein UY05_C0003G0022, partial [Candidatus Peregrinibacteria bacterium GW2011_GWA2_47_7]